MRVLAIRGKNLASLAGEFAVDFQTEPLASAGLFAITGLTGAGKSTLLDALCLALYEKTPRLGRAASRGESIPDVGENSVSPSDVRTMLRRGTSEGYAEVDFVGSDGVHYRSRWSVRRAHNKAQGSLQKSNIVLNRLTDGQVLGSQGKVDTLALIEKIIGLSFEQFTRAVLLAQNEFATFLKANDDERAELLQTLTGTETFAQISMQAFERMKTERGKLELLQVQLKDLAPLSSEARAEKEAGHESQAGQVKGLEDKKALLESNLRWYENLDALKKRVSEANTALQEAGQAKERVEGRERQLFLIERVQSARPLCAELDRVSAEREAIAKSAQVAKEHVEEAGLASADLNKSLEAADLAYQAAEAARVQAQPHLDAAKACDAQLELLKPLWTDATKAHEAAQKQFEEARKLEADTGKSIEQTGKDLVIAQGWLEDNADLRFLAERWTGWEVLFNTARRHIDERNLATGKVAEHKRLSAELVSTIERESAGVARLTDAFKRAADDLGARDDTLKVFDLDAMALRKQQFELRRERLLAADQAWKSLSDCRMRTADLESRRQAQEVVRDKGESLREELIASRPALEKSLESAEQALRIAEMAASETAEDLRARLTPDEPCPVCGSHDHPYVSSDPQVNAILERLEKNVSEARKPLSDLQVKLASCEAELKSSREQLAQIAVDLKSLEPIIKQAQQTWRSLPLSEELASVDEAQISPWLEEHRAMVKDALAGLSKDEESYRVALRKKEAAQKAYEDARKTLADAEKSLLDAEVRQKALAEAFKASTDRLVEVEQQLESALQQLDEAFPNLAWRERWQEQPQVFQDECCERVVSWNRQQQLILQLTGKKNTLVVSLGGQAEATAKAGEQEKQAAQQRDEQESRLKALERDRAALFDGKPVLEVERLLINEVTKAKTGLENSQLALQKAKNELTRLSETSRNLASQLGKTDAALCKSQSDLNAWLSDFNQASGEDALAIEDLRGLLGFDNEWIAAERAALQQLIRAMASADAVLKTHQVTLSQHEATKSITTGPEELRDELSRLLIDLKSGQELLTGIKAEIVLDDERLKQTEALRTSFEEQNKRSQIWAQLSDLIGSADGKKFRNFAQQLTLDILLGYGNRHLENLARRYRLVRITESLGLMVVDQEMGDEVRSVHSLSGGESFLVSLALALGLASLSSHRVRVESLFIDEGFGSLDADSLNVAMEALDSLQAMGRKVGVISHVQDMNERISTRIEVKRQAGGVSRIVIA